jgi:peptide/nickel transport system ATP-binding protein
MMGLERPTEGQVVVEGIPLDSKANLARVRDVAQMVFQDPMGSLDPRLLVEDVVAEPLRALGIGGDHHQRVKELLDAVSLPADAMSRYPHEFSGGQRQRIAIARALAPGPRLLIADEPVSALDMSVQTVTLDLLDRLKEEFNLTMVFISHDLSVIHEISDRVVVMEDGRLVETGAAGALFANPREQYTRDLLSAIPRLDGSFLGGGTAL